MKYPHNLIRTVITITLVLGLCFFVLVLGKLSDTSTWGDHKDNLVKENNIAENIEIQTESIEQIDIETEKVEEIKIFSNYRG